MLDLPVMLESRFSLRSNSRTYGIVLRERNYPTFEGRYNAYVSVYGQLSGDYLGLIEQPLAYDVDGEYIFDPASIEAAVNLIFKGYKHSIW